MGEARPRLRLELVAGEMLRLEREGVSEVRFEVGGALARDPVDEIERDVVKSGITKMMHGAPDVVRTGNALQRLEETRLEGLRPERDARHARAPERSCELFRDGLGVRLDRHLLRRRQGVEQPHELGKRGERRRSSAEEDRLEVLGEERPLELQLAKERVNIGPMLAVASDDGDEVAAAAAVGTEREMHVQVPGTVHASSLRGRATRSPLQFGQT